MGPKFQLAYGVHPSQVSQSKREIQEQARSLFVGKRAPTGEHEFDQLCAERGIEHRLTKSRTPQTNGMVERFNGRISDVLQSHHFVSGEDLAQTLYRYVLLYNQQLPQSTLGSKTPLDAMQRWYESHPHLFVKRPCKLAGGDIDPHGVDYMDASLLPRSICRVLTNKNRLQFYIRPVVQAYPAGPDGIR